MLILAILVCGVFLGFELGVDADGETHVALGGLGAGERHAGGEGGG